MLNHITMVGNLGDDPQVWYQNDGGVVASFTIAFNCQKKQTGWIKVVCFNRTADAVVTYLHKGARVAVSGSYDQQKWTDDNNNTRVNHQIIANSIEFIRTDGRGLKEGQNLDEPF